MAELLIESYYLNEAAIKDDKLVLRGLFQKANAKNSNGRVYPREILEREVNKLTPAIKERRLVGELDHPESAVIAYSNASHIITSIQMQGDDVIGELEVLKDLPKGKILEGLIKAGVKIGVSSRGLGTVRKEGEYLLVNDDFQLVTEDVVAEPSTIGAFVAPIALSESLMKKLLRKDISKPANLRKGINSIVDEIIRNVQNG